MTIRNHVFGRRLWFAILACTVMVLGVTAFSVRAAAGEFTDEVNSPVSKWVSVEDNLGQTFVARHGGLEAISVFLSSDADGTAQLTLHLRVSPFAAEDLRSATVSLPSSPNGAWETFRFPAETESNGQSYYFFIEPRLQPGTHLRAQALPAESYFDGALYLNGAAQDGQMAMRLAYRSDAIIADLLVWVADTFRWCLVALAVMILPGAMVLSSLPLSLATRFALAAGATTALYAVVGLWTHALGLQVMTQFSWLFTSGGVFWIGACFLRADWGRAAWRRRWIAWIGSERFWPALSFAVAFGLVVFTRLFILRGLSVPLWGDSYQHTVIAQLISDHNGLFSSWEPYADLQSFTYHFGFHMMVAAWHWATQMSMPQATLWTGQLLNICAIVTLCPLAAWIGGGRWAWPATVVVAGLLSPMPMFYVNWGRYTQLAGQLVLPMVVVLTWLALSAEKREWRLLVIAAFAWGGLALTHYRVLIMGMCFALAWVVIVGWHRQQWERTARLAMIAGGGAIFFVPWLVNTFGGKMLALFQAQIGTPAAATPAVIVEYNSVGDPFLYLPPWLWLVMVIAVGWAIRRAHQAVAVGTLWWLGVLVSANPQWLALPGQGAVSNFTVFIAAYIPAAFFVGAAAGTGSAHLIRLARPYGRLVLPVAVMALIVAVSLIGARQRLADLHVNSNALALLPDLKAAEWISNHTPSDAKFLVNTMFAYGGTVLVGTDGGWWLPLLARRQTMLPPINYANESGPQPDYGQRVNALPALIQQKGVTSVEVLAQLRAEKIGYVYIGQLQGRSNYNGPYVLLPDELLASPAFRPVYHQDRIWIFEIQ